MSLEASTTPPSDGVVGQARGRVGARARRGSRASASIEILRDAAAGLRRNALMALAATSTIVVALAVAGGGMLVSANLVHLASMLEGQVEIVAFLRDGLSPTQRQQVLASISASPGVRSAVIVDRGLALRRLQRSLGTPSSMSDLLPSNPLPDSVEVRVTDAGRIRDAAAGIQKIAGVEEVIFGTPVVDRLVALTRAVRLAGGVIAALLAAAALLIIVNTIRLTVSARRQEIEIMTLVGATPGFIRGPFMLEGAFQGASAALVTSIVLGIGYAGLAGRVAASLPFLPLLPPEAILPAALGVVWILGIAVGIGGSAIGLRRYLRA
ncbi:MAG: ABC transporter permease [Armatimonadetes bacterium]|nr:ABC transporter permease [Armatimonadota bacterium]